MALVVCARIGIDLLLYGETIFGRWQLVGFTRFNLVLARYYSGDPAPTRGLARVSIAAWLGLNDQALGRHSSSECPRTQVKG